MTWKMLVQASLPQQWKKFDSREKQRVVVGDKHNVEVAEM